MKNYSLIIILAFVASVFMPSISSAQNSQEALEYMKEVQDPTVGFESELWKYLRVMARSRSEKRIEKRRISLGEKIQEYHGNVAKVVAYSSDDSYRLAMLEYLDISSKVINEDYAEIMDLEEIMERSFDDFEAYVLAQEEANKKLEEAADALNMSLENFAATNDIILNGGMSRTGHKIANANKALGHYNDINLIIMKCSYQEGYAIDAMNRKDVNGMQQSMKTLAEYAIDGLENVESIEAHKGDTKLKYAGKRWLQFYKNEAEKLLPKQVEFYIANDEFDKATKKIESIKARKRTKEDIKNYNAQVNKFNKLSNAFNRTNETLNNNRTKNHNSWESSVENFMAKHVN